jgi:Reverse transcriptase (RNA-dependent DNA polymerase)
VDLLVQVERSFGEYMTYTRGKKVLYASLNKALYGTVQASLLFWRQLLDFLINQLDFIRNPYNWCVVNKIIDDKQCTVVWYVDDLKISHKDPEVVSQTIELIREEFGSKMDVPVCWGKLHEYLGIQIDFSEDKKVKMTMYDYLDELIREGPANLMKGTSVMPAANHFFAVSPDCPKLDKVDTALYHCLTAKLLYLSKRTRPDLLLAISFLTKRVQCPDTDDWKKLGRCLGYQSETRHLPFVLSANNTSIIQWWVDASFAVHPNMQSHTGATMLIRTGCPYSISRMQKLNTWSSMESELVGVNDAMLLIIWTQNFLKGQGFPVNDDIVFQDNQSAMLLEQNGKMSRSQHTRHLDIRYFFVTDQVNKNAFALNTA